MSLDVYLKIPGAKKPKLSSGIFIRENGENRDISVEEWNERFPDREPVKVVYGEDETTDTVYSANITHNLGKMADAVGVYKACWRPDENEITKAGQLTPILIEGLKTLVTNPRLLG